MTSPEFNTIRQQFRSVVDDVLDRVSAARLFQDHGDQLSRLDFIGNAIATNDTTPLTLVGIGKMADALAAEFVSVFGIKNVQGVISSPYEPQIEPIDGIEYFKGGHPVPNAASLAAARLAMQLVASVEPDHPVIYFISGGGSACFELPQPPIDLAEARQIHQTLVHCGASIGDINRIRQKLSQVKGGKLAAACPAKNQLALIVSDVKTDQLQFVSSGPTINFHTDVDHIDRILEQHSLENCFSTSVVERLRSRETSTGDGPSACQTVCLASNEYAVDAAADFFRSMGWKTKVDHRFDEHPIGSAANGLLESLRQLQNEFSDQTCCVVAGGEVISKVTGGGRGGRNQAFVLNCVAKIAGQPIAVLSFGTDGIDGNSPAAGALADGLTQHKTERLGFQAEQFARDSNAFEFFDAIGDGIVTGPTQTNVRDVRVLASIAPPN